MEIMTQVTAWDDPWNVEADKVGGWLMNEVATEWDQVGWRDPPPSDMIANLRQYEFMNRDQPVSNQDYGDQDNCTAEALSRVLTPSATKMPETPYSETVIGETAHGGELLGGLFD